jgi:hypothetical protein
VSQSTASHPLRITSSRDGLIGREVIAVAQLLKERRKDPQGRIGEFVDPVGAGPPVRLVTHPGDQD